MKIRVSLGMSSKSKKNDADFFKSLFSSMSLQLVEPECPFCGKPLKNAACRCSQFRQAEKKLLNSYNQKELFVSISPQKSSVTLLSLSDKNIQVQPVEFDKKMLKLFDYGSVSKNLEQAWFVSLGKWQNGILSFYIREKGKEQVYLCSVSDIPQKFSRYPSIRVLVHKREYPYEGMPKNIVGRYIHINHDVEVEKMSYQTFLTRLKE